MKHSNHESNQYEKNYQNELLKYVNAEKNKLIRKSESFSSSSEPSCGESFCITSDDISEFKNFQIRYAKIVKENIKLLNDMEKYQKYQKQMQKNLQTYHEMFQNANEKLIRSENTQIILEENLNKFISIAKQQILGKTTEE